MRQYRRQWILREGYETRVLDIRPGRCKFTHWLGEAMVVSRIIAKADAVKMLRDWRAFSLARIDRVLVDAEYTRYDA